MIKKSIKRVTAWAIKNRPPEYIARLKSKCVAWNVGKDFYEITEEGWNELAEKYNGTKQVINKPRNQKCPLATRTCCGEPDICSKQGCDCTDPFNKECKIRIGE